MQTGQATMREVTIAVYPDAGHYFDALALDGMRWVTGAPPPSVGRVDEQIEAFATRGMMLLTREDAALVDSNLGPAVVVPEGALVLQCAGWASNV